MSNFNEHDLFLYFGSKVSFRCVECCISLCTLCSPTNTLPCFLFQTLLQPSEVFDLLLNLSPGHPDEQHLLLLIQLLESWTT